MSEPVGLSFNLTYIDANGVQQTDTIESLADLASAQGGSIQQRFAILYMLLAQSAGEKAQKTLDTITAAQNSVTAANEILAELSAKSPYPDPSTPSDQIDLTQITYTIPNTNPVQTTTYAKLFQSSIGYPAGVENDKIITPQQLEDTIEHLKNFIDDTGVEIQGLTTIANSELGTLNSYITGASTSVSDLSNLLTSLSQKL